MKLIKRKNCLNCDILNTRICLATSLTNYINILTEKYNLPRKEIDSELKRIFDMAQRNEVYTSENEK